MKKKFPLYVKILLAMLVGIAFGYIAIAFGIENFVANWIEPWGTIFIRLLKLIAIPLVFISLIKGVVQMKDISKLSGLGIKTISIYIVTTLIAVLTGVGMVTLINPGEYFPKDKTAELLAASDTDLSANIEQAGKLKETGPLDFVVNIIPENLTVAAGDNSAMLQIIFVAMLIGIAMLSIGKKVTAVLEPIIDAVDLVILKIVDFIMNFAPVGVFALMATTIAGFSGDIRMFGSLGMYALTVVLTLLLIAMGFYPVFLWIFRRIRISEFLKGVFPIQLMAFSTSSSSATLPFTMEHAQQKMGVSEETASFVFPLGATINMDGTSAYQAIAIIFIAQIMNIDLTLAQMLSIVLLTVIASIGTPGVPGASIVMTVMVLTTVGIPVEGLMLILGIDRILDMLRTVVNVTGDVFVAKLIDKPVSSINK
jgi:Na+/H+-dicarboxylate symporter